MASERSSLVHVLSLLVLLAAVVRDVQAGDAPPDPEPRWLERLEPADRRLLQEWVGYAPPAFPPTVTFVSGERLSWEGLRGKIVVLQSWSNRRSDARSAVIGLLRLAEEHPDADLQVVLLHTPEGADRLQKYLERKPLDAPVVLDGGGAYCDALGIYKEPVNVVIDRQGAVRYVGLNRRGLAEVVPLLVGEPFDSDRVAAGRPENDAETGDVAYPPINSGRINAKRNLQGQKAPAFYVQSWINQAPASSDKVMMIDFWATWCGLCRGSIPHLNDLAHQFRDDLNVIGISDESRGAFEDGFRKHRDLNLNEIRYHLALDPSRQMHSAIGIQGIPHCIVISRDGIVRWQGHPAVLNASTLEQIIAADGGSGSAGRGRWARESS